MAALDVVPDMRPTKIKAGDVIELGDHRIICGDSTDVTVVSRLMGGEGRHLLDRPALERRVRAAHQEKAQGNRERRPWGRFR